jgi:hypothetical protein
MLPMPEESAVKTTTKILSKEKKTPENDQSAGDPRYHYERDSEDWVSNPETEVDGLLEDESLAGERPVMPQEKL